MFLWQETIKSYQEQYTKVIYNMQLHPHLGIFFVQCQSWICALISVTLYRCEVDRPDCSRCLSDFETRPELMCGWCRSDTMCTVSDSSQCSGGWITSNDNINCPAPVLSGVRLFMFTCLFLLSCCPFSLFDYFLWITN